MPAPVIIDFILRGMPDVTRAFRTVEQAALASERSRTTAAQRAGRERTTTADREAREKIRAMLKADAETRRAQDRATRDAAKSAQQRTRAEQREMHQMVREAEKSAQARLRIEQRVDREFAQMRKRQERERERIIREDDRREEQAARNRLRIRERSATMAGRHAEKQAKEDEGAREKFLRTAHGGVVAGGRLIGRAASATAGMIAQLGGGFSVADSVARQGQLERASIALSNSAYIPGQNERLDPKRIAERAKAASTTTGMEATDLVEATKAYVAKSSDIKGGMANMEFFGQIAKATDTNAQDVAKTAGILRVQNKNLGPDEMKQMLLDVIMQGKKGSVEFEDLASVAGKVTRSSAAYGGSQTENQRKLLGLSQIAIRTAGNPNEAATVLSNISADAAGHSKDIKAALGEGAFNARGQIAKGPDEFIADVMEKTGGNLMKIQGMGFGQRSMKMFQALAPTFNEAADKLGKNATPEQRAKAGREAVVADMRDVTAASYTQKALEDDLGKILNSSAEQYEKAMRELRTVVGERLAPELIKLIPPLIKLMPTIEKLLDVFVRIVDWAGSNPFAAMTGLVIGSVTKSIVAAKIGDVIKNLLLGGGGGGGGGGAGGAVAGNAAGALKSPVGLGIAAGVAAGAVAGNAELKYAEGAEKGEDLAAKVRAWKRGDTDRGVSPEQAMGEIAAAKQRLDKTGGTFNQVGNILASPFSESASKEYSQYKSDQAFVDNKNLIEALKEVTTALKQSGGVTGGAGGAAPAGNSGAAGAARGKSMTERN